MDELRHPELAETETEPGTDERAAASAGVAAGRAAAITRGVCRLLAQRGESPLKEVILADGRRADVMALDDKGGFTVVEVKSCRADFTSDRKWAFYRAFCDRFYFAVDSDFPRALLPKDCGLIVADAYEGVVLREAPSHRLHASRRKALTLRFGRLAARRLHLVDDPELPLFP